ncbi:hypothetical protein HHK36_016091 [Tetracentron sinense]|uniref:PPM-type phosphatase domain-containing protein n=1 Tax=Tetracentron sinense TaxID=13715 RepID=A0A834YWK2_TETSI|nr:hypothetical protein HHK36_016091 [Tetracentron sinense]
MGACCGKNDEFDGFMEEEEEDVEEENDIRDGDCGARVRLQGSSRFASMFTQKGRKGINQDAMTMWEDFTGEKDMIFCGVFDGHGPSGHNVASHVRDVLPSKLSSTFITSGLDGCNHSDVDINGYDDDNDDHDKGSHCHPSFSSWKANFIKAFKEMDEELSLDPNINCFCSGTTAVAILKQEGHLIIANLGDSRAVLCSRGKKNQPVPDQLTVDLKPNLPGEAKRISNCRGRIFATEKEPDVFRLWLPDQNCPGLAMARAFGDFCLKDFGLIATPKISYRKLTNKDEFVVLATDGLWDVLSNKEVVKIVASAKKRSMAAKLLVDRAVQAWRSKYPTSKVDDCAAICLFLKVPLTKSMSNVAGGNANDQNLVVPHSSNTIRSERDLEFLKSTMTLDSKEEWSALEGVSRVNSLVKLPRFANVMSWRKRSAKDNKDEEYYC